MSSHNIRDLFSEVDDAGKCLVEAVRLVLGEIDMNDCHFQLARALGIAIEDAYVCGCSDGYATGYADGYDELPVQRSLFGGE